jgi:hydroxymethylglutaryl-CoA lyase
MKHQNKRVIVQEVGMRDGLQSISAIMPTALKKQWIDGAYACGIRHMEVASFVPARLLPQMADADEIVAHALQYRDLAVTALAPNLRGAERALAAGVHRIVAPVSVSAAHSLANVRKTPLQMVEEFQKIRALRDALDPSRKTQVIAGLSTVFGCALQGAVPLSDVKEMAQRLLDAGCDLLAFGDTTGAATPGQVHALCALIKPIAGTTRMAAHFHDTRGMALANTLVALEYGIDEFDASLAGLGGCPHAPGATGNVATEDLVFLLHSMGYETGIDLEHLLASRALLQDALPGTTLYGSLGRAGIPKGFAETMKDIGKGLA